MTNEVQRNVYLNGGVGGCGGVGDGGVGGCGGLANPPTDVEVMSTESRLKITFIELSVNICVFFSFVDNDDTQTWQLNSIKLNFESG